MATPAEIRNEWLKRFYEAPPTGNMDHGPDTFSDEIEIEIRWLLSEGLLEYLPGTKALQISPAGREEWNRRLAEGDGPCPTCGRG